MAALPGRVSRRTVAKGAAWALPAIAVVSAAPALAASPFECPTSSCLATASGSAPSWTSSTPDAGASTLINWTMGSFKQTCLTDTSIAWYWFFCPTKVSANTALGHSFAGTITAGGPCDQTNGVTVAASPTLGVLFNGYTFGYDDCLNVSDKVGHLYQDYLTSISLTYYLQFTDAGGSTVSTTNGTNCPYTISIPVTQNHVCGALSGSGSIGQLAG